MHSHLLFLIKYIYIFLDEKLLKKKKKKVYNDKNVYHQNLKYTFLSFTDPGIRNIN